MSQPSELYHIAEVLCQQAPSINRHLEIMPATLSGLERGPACHSEHSEGSGSTDGEILRCAQDDKIPACHPERSEGSLVDFWGITRGSVLPYYDLSNRLKANEEL